MIDDTEFSSLVFHWTPATNFLKTFANIIARLVPHTFSRNGVPVKPTDAMVAKLAGYLNAESYSEYLKIRSFTHDSGCLKGRSALFPLPTTMI